MTRVMIDRWKRREEKRRDETSLRIEMVLNFDPKIRFTFTHMHSHSVYKLETQGFLESVETTIMEPIRDSRMAKFGVEMF